MYEPFAFLWNAVVGPASGRGILESGIPFWLVALGAGSLLIGAVVVAWERLSLTLTETESPATRPSDEFPPPPEPTDEERIVRLLESNGGRMRQARIVERTDWSKAKVSLLLSEMDADGTIHKLPIGRENVISLRGAEPVSQSSIERET
jgi:uncharacterized membrane protein